MRREFLVLGQTILLRMGWLNFRGWWIDRRYDGWVILWRRLKRSECLIKLLFCSDDFGDGGNRLKHLSIWTKIINRFVVGRTWVIVHCGIKTIEICSFQPDFLRILIPRIIISLDASICKLVIPVIFGIDFQKLFQVVFRLRRRVLVLLFPVQSVFFEGRLNLFDQFGRVWLCVW